MPPTARSARFPIFAIAQHFYYQSNICRCGKIGSHPANTNDALEQKRRQAIREGFDRLTEMVPGLEGQGRSEGLVLKRTVEYMRQQISERQEMIQRIEQSGGAVDHELRA